MLVTLVALTQMAPPLPNKYVINIINMKSELHTGVCIGITILICMSVICHLSNWFHVKSMFTNVERPENQILYYGSDSATKVCPGSHPYLPCRLIKKCPTEQPTLSEEDQAVLEKYVYLNSLISGIDFFKFKDPATWYI